MSDITWTNTTVKLGDLQPGGLVTLPAVCGIVSAERHSVFEIIANKIYG